MGRKKAQSSGWTQDPLAALKRTLRCHSCGNEATIQTSRNCGGCMENVHQSCLRQVDHRWVINLKTFLSPGPANVCQKCQERYRNNLQWLQQEGLDTYAPDFQKKAARLLDDREERTSGKAWSYFSEWKDFGEDLKEARAAVKRITDLVYTSSGGTPWRVKFEGPNVVPHAQLALHQLILPDIFTHPRTSRMSKTAVMDILTGLALHEAGHGEYTTLPAARRVASEQFPELGGNNSNPPMVWWDTMTNKEAHGYTDESVAQYKVTYAGNDAYANRFKKVVNPRYDAIPPVKRKQLHLMWNLVEDFYLEHKLRARFPGWDSYLHMSYAWIWAKAAEELKNTLKTVPNAQNKLTVRITVAIWHILAPEKIEGKVQIPRELVLLANEARKLAVGRLLAGSLETDNGKIRLAIDLLKLLTDGCEFDDVPPTGGDSTDEPGEGKGKPEGGKGKGQDPKHEESDDQEQGSGPNEEENEDGEEGGEGQPGSKDGEGSDVPGTPGRGSPSGRQEHSKRSQGNGLGHEEDEDQPSSGRDLDRDGSDDEQNGDSDSNGSEGTDGDPESDDEDTPSGLHSDDYGYDGGEDGRGKSELTNSDEEGQGNGHGAGRGGGVTNPDFVDPSSIGKADEDELSAQEQKLLEAMDAGDQTITHEHAQNREDSKKLEYPVKWKEDAVDSRHEAAHRVRKQQLEPIINRVKKSLMIRNVQSDQKTGELRRGRLDRRSLYRVVAANDQNVFWQKKQNNLPKVRIGLLVDESGSMGSMGGRTPTVVARETATILAHSFEGIRGVKLWVAGYSDSYSYGEGGGATIQAYVTPQRKRFEALERPPMGGGTPTGECMWKLAQVMSENLAWDEQAFMFVITDGGYGGDPAPERVESMFPKVTFIEVLVGGGQPQGLKFSLNVNSVSDFTDSMTKIISNILLGGQLQ